MSERDGTYISFAEVVGPKGGKTKRWSVRPRGEDLPIGWVMWYAPWRKYTYESRGGIVYEQVCLREIAEFVERKTREHKEERKK